MEVFRNLGIQVTHFENNRNTADKVGSRTKGGSRTRATGSPWTDLDGWNPIASSRPASLSHLLSVTLLKKLYIFYNSRAATLGRGYSSRPAPSPSCRNHCSSVVPCRTYCLPHDQVFHKSRSQRHSVPHSKVEEGSPAKQRQSVPTSDSVTMNCWFKRYTRLTSADENFRLSRFIDLRGLRLSPC